MTTSRRPWIVTAPYARLRATTFRSLVHARDKALQLARDLDGERVTLTHATDPTIRGAYLFSRSDRRVYERASTALLALFRRWAWWSALTDESRIEVCDEP